MLCCFLCLARFCHLPRSLCSKYVCTIAREQQYSTTRSLGKKKRGFRPVCMMIARRLLKHDPKINLPPKSQCLRFYAPGGRASDPKRSFWFVYNRSRIVYNRSHIVYNRSRIVMYCCVFRRNPLLCFGFGSLQAALPNLPPLPSGTGVAGYLCTEASSASGEEGTGAAILPPLVVLLRFCGEGDNTPEAIEVAQAVNASLKLLPGGGDTEGASPG